MEAANVGPPAPAAAANHTVPTVAVDTKGRHRMMAELKRLELETRSLEEELEELGRTEKVSATLQGLLNIIERTPDPLLPEILGPADPSWDRWFERIQDPRAGFRCWIL